MNLPLPNAATLVLGASPDPTRYAYKAVQLLRDYGHIVEARGRQAGSIFGVPIKPIDALASGPLPEEQAPVSPLAQAAADAAEAVAVAVAAENAPASGEAQSAEVEANAMPLAAAPIATSEEAVAPVAEPAPAPAAPKPAAYKPGSIDTVTMYVRPEIQAHFADAILAMKPRRVIFNPDTENPELAERLQAAGIHVVEACTLVLLRSGQYQLA